MKLFCMGREKDGHDPRSQYGFSARECLFPEVFSPTGEDSYATRPFLQGVKEAVVMLRHVSGRRSSTGERYRSSEKWAIPYVPQTTMLDELIGGSVFVTPYPEENPMRGRRTKHQYSIDYLYAMSLWSDFFFQLEPGGMDLYLHCEVDSESFIARKIAVEVARMSCRNMSPNDTIWTTVTMCSLNSFSPKECFQASEYVRGFSEVLYRSMLGGSKSLSLTRDTKKVVDTEFNQNNFSECFKSLAGLERDRRNGLYVSYDDVVKAVEKGSLKDSDQTGCAAGFFVSPSSFTEIF